VFKFMVMVVCNYFWVDDVYIAYVFHNKMHNNIISYLWIQKICPRPRPHGSGLGLDLGLEVCPRPRPQEIVLV